ncbi:hypothetical protein VTJ83DRAFT_7255 [Remersonia thermophila]|uniref:Amidohydrolase-related domain-containing protein n=1 Tax=Remersonia thermophila TaxID=72144 RepID=A0ABR4D303_9PEZI
MPSPLLIDSHVHLPSSSTSESPSLAEYHTTTTTSSSSSSLHPLAGVILIGSDHPNDDEPLRELASMSQAAAAATASSAPKVLALVPSAPFLSGPAKLEEYLAQAEKEAGSEAWKRVRGFRYLLRGGDKAARGAALEEELVEGLKLLGRKGFVVEVALERGGRAQLEEVVEMVGRAHEGVAEGEEVVFVLDHLGKPDLTVINQADPSFLAWRSAMFTLGKSTKTYLKLSGCFSELPERLKSRSAEDIFSAILQWLAVVVAAFGPRRLMFGSDWPLCADGVGDDAWGKWHRVVEMVCDLAGLSEEDQAMLWGGTAKEAYGLDC